MCSVNRQIDLLSTHSSTGVAARRGVPTLFQGVLAGLLIVSVDSFDRAQGSQVNPPTRRHFRYEGLLRAACCSRTAVHWHRHGHPVTPPFLIHVKASPPIKINRVDAARQVASLGYRKVASSFEFQAPSKNLVKLHRRSTR